MPSNVSGKLTLDSILAVGWRGVGEKVDKEPGSIDRSFVYAGGELVFASSSSISILA
jgi:hypothetical protein